MLHHRSRTQSVESAGGRSGYIDPEEVSSSSLLHRRAADWRRDISLKHSNASHSHPSGHLVWFANAGTCSTCEGQYWKKIWWPKCPLMLWPWCETFYIIVLEYYRSTRGESEVEKEILRWEKLSIASIYSSLHKDFWLQLNATAKRIFSFYRRNSGPRWHDGHGPNPAYQQQ